MRRGGMRLGGARGLLPRDESEPGGARVRLELGVAHLEGGRLHTLHLQRALGSTCICTHLNRPRAYICTSTRNARRPYVPQLATSDPSPKKWCQRGVGALAGFKTRPIRSGIQKYSVRPVT